MNADRSQSTAPADDMHERSAGAARSQSRGVGVSRLDRLTLPIAFLCLLLTGLFLVIGANRDDSVVIGFATAMMSLTIGFILGRLS